MIDQDDVKSSIYDGGPAFPVRPDYFPHEDACGFCGVTHWTMGMSRRDYFAAAALSNGGLIGDAERIAGRAYAIADAMLKASQETIEP